MSKLRFMSDDRHAELIKAAESCATLMSIGVEPDAALLKVAEDNAMTDNEVMLVSHAVNNSKQIAHLQTSDPEDRESPFPVTNADKVIAERQLNTPVTESAKVKQEQPDGLDISGKVSKEAAARSRIETTNYRTADIDYAGQLKAGWALDSVPSHAMEEKSLPMAELGAYQHAIEEGRLKIAAATDEAHRLLDEVMLDFRRADAPKFAAVEKVAHQLGCSDELIGVVYTLGRLERFGEQRADLKTKTASTLYVDPTTAAVARKIVDVDNFMKAAADATAAVEILTARQAKLQAKLTKSASDKEEKDAPSSGKGDFSTNAQLKISPLDMKEVGNIPGEMLFGADPAAGAVTAIHGEVAGDKPKTTVLDQSVRQELEGIDAQSRIRRLLQDRFVSGADISEVVDAYNNAMSVNPKFGDAELLAYVRQALATQNAMPLDLMIRASKSHQSGGSEE